MSLTLVLLSCLVSSIYAKPLCPTQRSWDAAADDPADRAELVQFAQDMKSSEWYDGNRNWLSHSVSVCEWQGVCCIEQGGRNRITELHVERNGLRGAFSSTFAGTLNELRVLNVHLNYVTNFPPGVSRLTNLQEAKFGRNPICGNAPELLAGFAPLAKLTKFNCNFCCLSGEFPDHVLANKPMLEEIFWDGNNFSGAIPPSAGLLQSLTKISFNLNSMVGAFPAGLTKMPPLLNLTDCRLGSDTDFTPYDTSPGSPERGWLLQWRGNSFTDCPHPPSVLHSMCNMEGKGYTPSPLNCSHADPALRVHR